MFMLSDLYSRPTVDRRGERQYDTMSARDRIKVMSARDRMMVVNSRPYT